jgi:hypothetical protein
VSSTRKVREARVIAMLGLFGCACGYACACIVAVLIDLNCPGVPDDEDDVMENAMLKDMDKEMRINYDEFADEFAKISLEISAIAEEQKERRVLVRPPSIGHEAPPLTPTHVS